MVKFQSALPLLAWFGGSDAGKAQQRFNGDTIVGEHLNNKALEPGQIPRRPVNLPPAWFTDRSTPAAYTQIYGVNGGAGNCGHGLVADRIMGGMTADIQDNPWAVFYLGCQNINLPGRQCFRCGGAIISPRWIITAASCNHATVAAHSGIVYGTADILTSTGKTVPSSNWADVYSIVKHASYDARARNYDIAAVSTTADLLTGPNVYPICLPSIETCLTSGTQVEVMGYGDTDANSENKEYSTILQVTKLPIVRFNVCKRYHNSEHMSRKNKRQVRTRNICAGDSSTVRQHVCDGDGGGPMVWKDMNGIAQLIGIASYGFGCKDFGQVAIFTRMTSFGQWIETNTLVTAAGTITGTSTCVDAIDNPGSGMAFNAQVNTASLTDSHNQIKGYRFLQSFCAYAKMAMVGAVMRFLGPAKCGDINNNLGKWVLNNDKTIQMNGGTLCWSADTTGTFPVTVVLQTCNAADTKQHFVWTSSTGVLTTDVDSGNADVRVNFYKDAKIQVIKLSEQRNTMYFDLPNADGQILTKTGMLHKQYCALKEGGLRIRRFQKIKFFPMTDHRCAGKKAVTKWYADTRMAVAGMDSAGASALVIKDAATKKWCWNMNPRAGAPQPIYLHRCRHAKPWTVNSNTAGNFVKGENWWQRFVWNANGVVQSQINLNNVNGGGAGNAFMWFNRNDNVNPNKKKTKHEYEAKGLGRRFFPFTQTVGVHVA